MAPSSRDRLSVDLHGLKAALLDRARDLRMSPSSFVRAKLAEALDRPADGSPGRHRLRLRLAYGDRVRLSLRMNGDDVQAAREAARRAGLSLGDYVGGLVAGVPVLTTGARRGEHISALMASNAELATLSRNIHRLTALLRQADVEPARPYREMLDTLAGDVRRHLKGAASLLADLRPQYHGTRCTSRSGQRQRDNAVAKPPKSSGNLVNGAMAIVELATAIESSG